MVGGETEGAKESERGITKESLILGRPSLSLLLSPYCSHPLMSVSHYLFLFIILPCGHNSLACQWLRTTTVSQGGELPTNLDVKGQCFISQPSSDASLTTVRNGECTRLDFCVRLGNWKP